MLFKKNCIITMDEIQWNTSITDTFGEQCFGPYIEVAFVERLFLHKPFIWDLGAWPLYSNWPFYSEVVVNRGSTVILYCIVLLVDIGKRPCHNHQIL